MPKDYIPVNDADFEAFVANFIQILGGHLGKLGLIVEDIAPLSEAYAHFSEARRAQREAEEVYRQAVAAKKRFRTHLDQTLRPLVRRVNAHPGMNDLLRSNLGVTISSRAPSHRRIGDEVPVVWLERHNGFIVVHFSATPDSREASPLPAWAIGWNVYRKTSEETAYQLIAFVITASFVETGLDSRVQVSYRVAYRGVRPTDIGPMSVERSLPFRG